MTIFLTGAYGTETCSCTGFPQVGFKSQHRPEEAVGPGACRVTGLSELPPVLNGVRITYSAVTEGPVSQYL